MADALLILQLQSIKEAQQRARKAFFLCLLVSCVVMFFSVSLTFSQNANKPKPSCCLDDNGDPYSSGNTRNHVKPGKEYELRLKAYLDQWNYSVPLLGITISLEDFGLIAPLSLFIFSFYYVSCLRNIVSQLEDLSQGTLSHCDRLMAKVTILSELVLNCTSKELAKRTSMAPLVARWSLQDVNVYQKLVLVPCFASFLALTWDLYYSYLRPVFTIGEPGSSGYREQVSFFTSHNGRLLAQASIVGSDIAGLIICFVVLSYCLAGRAYLRKSSSLSSRIIGNGLADCVAAAMVREQVSVGL